MNLSQCRSEETSPNYFAGLMEWDGFKVFFLVFHILLTFVGPILLYSVIWYEKSSFETNYRTVLNHLLSHICMISIARSFVVRIPHAIMLLMAPYSTETCNFIVFIGRYSFLCIHTELCIWQVIKFLYIFQWKHIVVLNEEFLAVYLTMWNLFMSLIFVSTIYMMGYHNAEPDFHICTGTTFVSELFAGKTTRIVLIQFFPFKKPQGFTHTLFLCSRLNKAIMIEIYSQKLANNV